MTHTKQKLLSAAFVVFGIIIISLLAYFNMIQYHKEVTVYHFGIPITIGGISGFAFANLYKLRQINKSLQSSKNEFKYMTDNISGKFVLYRYRGSDDIVTYISKGSEFFAGKKPEEIIGKRWQDIVSLDARTIHEVEMNQMEKMKNINKVFENEYHFNDHNGEPKVWIIHEYASIDKNEIIIHGIAEDITLLKLNQHQNRLYKNIFSHTKQALIITDSTGSIQQINQAFSQLTGYDEEEILGKNPAIFKSKKQEKLFYADMWNKLLVEKAWSGELWNMYKDGKLTYVSLSISAILDPQGHVTHYVGIFSDITEKRHYVDQLENNANYDPLTKLPNRAFVFNKIDTMITNSKTERSLNALAFIDLDGFKEINDAYGHEAGDMILCETANRLNRLIRNHDTFARLGGDEFILLLENISGEKEITPIIQRVITEIHKPITFNDHTLQISASIGLSSYKGTEAVDRDELIRRADKAMYLVKMKGKNGFEYYRQTA